MVVMAHPFSVVQALPLSQTRKLVIPLGLLENSIDPMPMGWLEVLLGWFYWF